MVIKLNVDVDPTVTEVGAVELAGAKATMEWQLRGHCKEVRACKLQGAQGGDFQSIAVNKINCCLVDLNYWDSISTLAGEVVLGYFPPVLVATGVVPLNRELWIDEYFSIIADIVGGVWLRWWLQAVAVMSNMEMFVAEMSSDSFQLLGMAERGMLLEFFGKRSCYETPYS
ncbi:hypothetical protein glysoja_049462 [Glycine soja]|uniref:Uncharacterized protein n=1 Tax=Glycine soja TaxID=3848 RepID=A0A0B2QD12_GLYSO|nr:hypothetical protein glysoja_049462 [Glycine soja]